MAPKNKTKRKAEKASQVAASKKLRLSLETVESSPAGARATPTLRDTNLKGTPGSVSTLSSMTETPGVAAGTDMPTTSGLTSVAGAGVGGDTPAMIEAPGVTTGTDTPTTSSVVSVTGSGVEEDTPPMIEALGVTTGTDTPTTSSAVSVTGSGVEEDTPPMIEALGVTTGTDTPTTSSAVGVADSGTSPKAPRKTQEILGKFVEEWLQIVDKEDMKNMAMFLCFQLVKLFGFTETKAAEYTATMINKSERTVRRWRSGLIENDGVFPESQKGRYQRSGVLWQNEELNKKATEYVRGNATVKGRPNLTTVNHVYFCFCKIMNFSVSHYRKTNKKY